MSLDVGPLALDEQARARKVEARGIRSNDDCVVRFAAVSEGTGEIAAEVSEAGVLAPGCSAACSRGAVAYWGNEFHRRQSLRGALML